MKSLDELRRENEVLRERISRLSAASLRISATLDVSTVLVEVVDSARALTGARYGVIVTINDLGQPQDFVTSGLTPEEQERLTNWSGGPQFFEHLRHLRGTLRLRDLPDYSRALEYFPDPMRSKTIQGTPMRHRGGNVGNFFLAAKEEGHEFTSEDEEILVMFAAQAATAIANARRHRDEQRARADLEALVDTSPVGVLVFDARTGNFVLANQEANRIVGDLCAPDRSADQLLEVVTFRRADGREIHPPGVPPARRRSAARRRCGLRRSSSQGPRRPAGSRRWSTPHRSAPRTVWSSPWSSSCRTWRRSRSWSGCGPSSWAW